MRRGVVVATDKELEWLLPWWWERYSACNTLPVLFVDFGMSLEKRTWCEERGQVVSLDKEMVSKKPIPKKLYAKWEKRSSPFWENYAKSYPILRRAWFKKPSACLLSPFDETVWIDVDCEILDSIDPIFSYLEEGKEIVVFFDVAEFLERGIDEGRVCNSGVIAFKKGSQIIQEWNNRSKVEAEKYFGDEQLLAEIVSKSMDTVAFLPEIYNWRICRGLPLDAKIIHWCGEWGKVCLAKHGGLKRALERI